jgi:hypothetical protein
MKNEEMEYEPPPVFNPGDKRSDYQGGNFLNAIDEVVKYFWIGRNMDASEIKSLLTVYADSVDG